MLVAKHNVPAAGQFSHVPRDLLSHGALRGKVRLTELSSTDCGVALAVLRVRRCMRYRTCPSSRFDAHAFSAVTKTACRGKRGARQARPRSQSTKAPSGALSL